MVTLAMLSARNNDACIIMRGLHTISNLNEEFYGYTSDFKGAK